MPLESPGAVLRLEARPALGARQANTDMVDARLREAKRLLETSAPAVEWLPDAEPGARGRVRLPNAADAFPLLHSLRTMLRADPGPVPLDLVAGIGAGDETEGLARAGDALQRLGRRRSDLTRAVTGDADADVVLAALCRTMDAMICGWTDAQWQAVHRRDRDRTLEQIGEELGIAYQNVSKRLIAARYSLYREVLGAAALVFSRSAQERAARRNLPGT
jgi:hypothetical protein